MKLLPHRAILARFVAMATLALGVAAVAPAAHAEDVTKSFTVNGRPNVRVDTNDGSVHVTSGDTRQVEFHVTYRGYVLNKDLSVDSRQDGDRGPRRTRSSNPRAFRLFMGRKGSRTTHRSTHA